MPSHNAMKVWRAWIALDEIPVPAYAFPATASIKDDAFIAEMGHCAEWGPISRGKKPLRSESRVSGFFKGSCGPTGGKLSATSSGFSIDAEDLQTAEFTAFTRDGEKTNPVRVLTTGGLDGQPRTIFLKPGGVFDSSPDLATASLTVVVGYSSYIEASSEDIADVTLYVVGKSDRPCILIYEGCKLTSLRDRRLSLALGQCQRVDISD